MLEIKNAKYLISLGTILGSMLGISTASAAPVLPPALRITEVNPTGNSASYAADWFEVTNFSANTIDITGWKMDDNSSLFSSAVSLRGVTSINPGQRVIFLEGGATSTNDSTIQNNFKSAWFGGSTPAGLLFGGYGGNGVGLSSSGDAVNLYNSSGVLQLYVTFGASTAGKTFDNAAGLYNTSISQLSATGTNGAFTSYNGNEIGSPGVVPVPAAGWLLISGLGGLGILGRRKRASK